MDSRFIDDQDELINPTRPRLRYIDHHIRPNCFNLSKRYTLAILAHIGFLIIFAMRSNVCFFNLEVLQKLYPNDTHTGKMYEIQGQMEVWFSIAYLLVQIPAAILSYKYPSQRVFGICILASSITAIMESFSLNWVSFEFGYAAFFQGLAQSASIPAVFGILYEWAPPSERATLTTIAYSGTFSGVLFGVVFSSLVCGDFEEEHLLALYGTAGIIWYLAWIWLVFERPEDHPTIADSEFEYLKRHIEVPKTKPPIQWRKIFTSMPCWAIFVVYLCRSSNSYYLFQADYLQYIYYDNKPLSVELPSLVMTIVIPASGLLADRISQRTSLSITEIRKYYICGGLFFEIIAFIPGLFLTEDSWPYIVDNKVLDLICYSFTMSGYFVNHLDIAPIYACVTMAISNLLGFFLGIYLMGYSGYRKPYGNTTYLYFMSAIHLFGIVFYGIWGSGEVQPWAKANDNENEGNSTSNRHNGIENPI
ncbi:vesicular glutamate transporter 2.2-like [Chrysoperla carnea]|uniref:vesicular glutamate transporter 2.2-like n=1 Tax=Chrysoperla carnea TaxID=189513 RepID=UPI001D086AFA|nr:vesicular glutamate transporter 2.2-like [Chrysoperla carnea]